VYDVWVCGDGRRKKVKITLEYVKDGTGLWCRCFTEEFGTQFTTGTSFAECRIRMLKKMKELNSQYPSEPIPAKEEVEI